MTKEEHQYRVISKMDCKKISKKLRSTILELNVGDEISVKSFFEKHKQALDFKNDRTARNRIANAFKIAHVENTIERINDPAAPEWFKKLDTVSFWQLQLRGSKFKNSDGTKTSTTKTQYLFHLWHFNKWILEKTFTINTLQAGSGGHFLQKTEARKFRNVEEVLRILEQPFFDQKNVIRIIKQYLLDASLHSHKKASYMAITKNAIVSYFEKNEYPLKIMFNPKVPYNTESEDQNMSLSDLMEFLTTGKPSILEKTVFLCKFQRGLDVSTLVDRFNYEAWEQVAKWFGSENHDSWDLEKCPVPVSLVRIKTDYKHVGFLDRDAIEMLQKYLDYRKTKTETDMQKGEPLFLNKFNRAISAGWMFNSFSRIAKRAGIQKFTEINGRKQYKMDSHELRDLLKSTLIDSGCRIDVADHVIGHKPRDSYEKQAILYPETLRREYSKASKRLNIFTKFTSVVSGNDDADELGVELREKLSELEKIREGRLDEEAARYRSEMVAAEQKRQMGGLLDTVNELKSQIDSMKNGGPKKLEFCCIDCSTVHGKQECPSCGSMMKRIYESSS